MQVWLPSETPSLAQIACDKDQVYLVVEGKAKTSQSKTFKAFREHIRKDSLIIHDDEKSHSILIETLGRELLGHK